MTTAILSLVAALIPLLLALLKWWLDGRDDRRKQAATDDVAEMGRAVADGDTRRISDMLDGL